MDDIEFDGVHMLKLGEFRTRHSKTTQKLLNYIEGLGARRNSKTKVSKIHIIVN